MVGQIVSRPNPWCHPNVLCAYDFRSFFLVLRVAVVVRGGILSLVLPLSGSLDFAEPYSCMIFTNAFDRNIDAKSRIQIPTQVRENLQSGQPNVL